MKRNDQWSESIGDAVRKTERNLAKSNGKLIDEEDTPGIHVSSKGHVMCYDTNCPICQKAATKVTTTTVYHKPNTHEAKIAEIERQKQLEDFKYNVAKNCTSIEKKVNKALDINNDELIRVNHRIDSLANQVNKTKGYDEGLLKDYIDRRMLEMDQRHHESMENSENRDVKLQSQIDGLRKVVEKLMDDRGASMTNEVEGEINNLYQKKREQAARLEQAMERISDLENHMYENQDALAKNKFTDRDLASIRQEVANKIEDLKLRQDQDLAQTNNRLMKRMDDLQITITEIDQNMDEIERRRLNGENSILKKSMQILKEGNIEGELLDLRRRVKDLENEANKPKERTQKINIEKEEIIREIVQGMATFEKDIIEMKKQITEHDRDIQDAAKLLHVLDQEKTKHQERLDNMRNKITDLEHLYESTKVYRVEQSQNIEELRLATESEFNSVKKAEISDFRNLNSKINELVVLQDVVEQLADRVEYLQKELDGIRNVQDHTPVRMKNKVGAENLTSSMTPSTMLLSDLKNRKTYYIDEEEIRSKPKGRNNFEGRNISFDDYDHRSSPMTDKVRESLFTRSRLSKYLADDYVNRDREYIQINNEPLHKDRDLARRLQGDSLQNSDNLKKISDMRQESYMPQAYKLKDNLGDDNRSHRSGSRDRRGKRKDSQSSKYSYDKQKEVNKKVDKLHKEGMPADSFGNKSKVSKNVKKSSQYNSYEEDGESEEDYSKGQPANSVSNKVNQLNKMSPGAKKSHK